MNRTQQSVLIQLVEARQQLAETQIKLEEVQDKLHETEDVLNAIRSGDVDALVVPGPDGDRIFSLKDADYAYRALVEAMNEGAAMLSTDGCVLYCNERFARLFETRLEQIIGSCVLDLVTQDGAEKLRSFFRGTLAGELQDAGFDCAAGQRSCTPIYISLRVTGDQAPGMLSMVVTDISARKQNEQKLQILIKEVHHRVKNNLQVVCSLLQMQAGSADDPQVEVALRNSQHRVQSMALIHELLYGSSSLADVDFCFYAGRLVEELLFSYQVDSDRVKLILRVAAMHLGIDTAIPCGLIMNELISNSLKYAFPNGRTGQLSVTLTHHDNNTVRPGY